MRLLSFNPSCVPEAFMSITHLHLLLNHFPIIGTLIGIGLLAFALVRKSDQLAKASLGLLVALRIIAVVVFLTGEPAEEAVWHVPGGSGAITRRHEALGLHAAIAMGALGAGALGARAAFRRRSLPRWATMASFGCSIVAGGRTSCPGLLGGQIRHTE